MRGAQELCAWKRERNGLKTRAVTIHGGGLLVWGILGAPGTHHCACEMGVSICHLHEEECLAFWATFCI